MWRVNFGPLALGHYCLLTLPVYLRWRDKCQCQLQLLPELHTNDIPCEKISVCLPEKIFHWEVKVNLVWSSMLPAPMRPGMIMSNCSHGPDMNIHLPLMIMTMLFTLGCDKWLLWTTSAALNSTIHYLGISEPQPIKRSHRICIKGSFDELNHFNGSKTTWADL